MRQADGAVAFRFCRDSSGDRAGNFVDGTRAKCRHAAKTCRLFKTKLHHLLLRCFLGTLHIPGQPIRVGIRTSSLRKASTMIPVIAI